MIIEQKLDFFAQKLGCLEVNYRLNVQLLKCLNSQSKCIRIKCQIREVNNFMLNTIYLIIKMKK